MAEGESSALLEDKCTNLTKELESGSKKQENEILKVMEDICHRLMVAKDEIARHKNLLTRFEILLPFYFFDAQCREVFRVMKQVAHIQTDIQFKLRKGMELMKRWRQGDNGYFQHLERIHQLPEVCHCDI